VAIKGLLLLACALAPAGLYLALWDAISDSVLNWIGYQLWLSGSIDDLLNNYRSEVVEIFCGAIMPVLMGFTGLAWGRWYLWRRGSSAAGADGPGVGGEAG